MQKPIVRADEIPAFNSSDDILIIDARSGPDALSRYQEGHLEGAVHVDLDKDLAKKPINPADGGRHPLPEPKDFAEFLGTIGVTPKTKLFVYDDKGGANAAARFWWMVRAAGHQDVTVISGGLQAAMRAGKKMTSAIPKRNSTSPYPFTAWNFPTATILEVEQAVKDPNHLVIDVRESRRFIGEIEPIDTVAGHIPGAVNAPFSDNLNPDQSFKSAKELAEKYKSLIGNRNPKNVIVHCGSGVTACHTLLAMEHAGIKGAKLYVGSWGEWSRTGKEIAKGAQ
jgi:thiosulfate/3-mercaptopyruvate sulfurtransferase